MIEKDNVIEISQVANGFIVRQAMSPWYQDDRPRGTWAGLSVDYLVFRTMGELALFLHEHFTHRAKVESQDAVAEQTS